MAWKVYMSMGRPEVRIAWDTWPYRTRFEINGKEIKPGEEIALNLLLEPRLRLSVVGENVGDPGKCWVLIAMKTGTGTYPLFVKQMQLGTGDIIVGEIDYKITDRFLEYYRYVTGEEGLPGFSIVAYVGHNDVRTELLATGGILLPFGYVVDMRRRELFRVEEVEDMPQIIEQLVIAHGGEADIDVVPIEPFEIRELELRRWFGEAGFDFYGMFVRFRGYRGLDLPFKVDLTDFIERGRKEDGKVIDDSTEGVL